MEYTGIRVDRDSLKEMSKMLAERLADIEQAIYTEVGYPLNINSTQQLSRALFETLKLELPGQKRKTASGLYSTAADVLEEMRGFHPVIDLILEFRELSKLKSTYVDALPQAINPRTGRVHTSFNQTGAVTGRLASSTQTCKTSQPAPNWAEKSADRSLLIPAICCCLWITVR